MMGSMTFRDRALAGQRLFVEFPDDRLADWLPAAEVLVQEGLAAWALPVAQLDLLPEALAVFGRRARVGVRGAATPQDVARAAASGAHFVTSPVASPALADAAGEVPFLAGALTPTEVMAAAAGGGAVQVVPADVLGTAYARTLPRLLPAVELVATGRLERFQTELWLQAGAAAVGLVGVILRPESGPGAAADDTPNDLEEVRRRAQSYRLLDLGTAS